MPPLAAELSELVGAIAAVKLRRAFGDDEPSYRFDRFEAITTVRGGMGLVIKAYDPKLERHVAIKIGMRSDTDAQKDLIAEAQILAGLRHSNVIKVFDIGLWKDRVYFVMEWIHGVDGRAWMRRRRSWREVRRVFLGAAAGLAAAHHAGIHHRDFKPSNILVSHKGEVMVADFGVAASLHSSPERDESGGLAGTPGYMAPERLDGRQGDARSDQFSFVAAMWRALYGRRPFAGDTIAALLDAMERGEFQESADVIVPRWLSDVLRKGLAWDPADRYRDMPAVIAALNDDPDERALEMRRRRAERERLHLAIGVLLGLVVVLGWLQWRGTPTQEQPAAGTAWAQAPYHVIMGLVGADDYAAAGEYWREHRSELTDQESLKVARACLTRSWQLDPAETEVASAVAKDRVKAYQAAITAAEIAEHLRDFGTSAASQAEAGELAAEARAAADRLRSK